MDKIFRKELLILLVGLFFLASGWYTGEPMQYFWGIIIVLGAVALNFVRKKDWKKHWEELELHKQAMEEQKKRREEENK